jgi:hypothetical protein
MAGNVICSNCGQENDAELTFCGSCGAFLEWSGHKVDAGDVAAAGAPATPVDRTGVAGPAAAPPAPLTTAQESPPDSELAGLARARPTLPGQLPPIQPPFVSPVRPGPSIRSVPPTPADLAPSAATSPSTAAALPDPTIACPACGRANPIDRNFCHSCGVLLRPKPAEPAVPRRRGAAGTSAEGRTGRYRLLSILLLIAIVIVGSFLLIRLTTHSSGPTALPSPTRASAGWLIARGPDVAPAVRWSVSG